MNAGTLCYALDICSDVLIYGVSLDYFYDLDQDSSDKQKYVTGDYHTKQELTFYLGMRITVS